MMAYKLMFMVTVIICYGQQLMFCEGNVDSAVKKLMNDNMATMIKNVLKNEPVIKMLYISYHRFWFHLGHINDAGRSGTKIDKLYIGRSASYTRYSTKRTMCYAPRFHDYHKSYLAILAFNLEKIFPCIAGKNIVPICRLYTGEEDGFNRGRPIIEAGDRGNNFNMFGRKPVYGFAVQGCRYFTTSCMPVWWQTTLTCMLPRKYCS